VSTMVWSASGEPIIVSVYTIRAGRSISRNAPCRVNSSPSPLRHT
jgi:hypothetical protein